MSTVKVRIGPRDHGRAMSLEEFAEAEAAPGNLYELAEGVIVVVDIPGLPHGKVLYALELQLAAWELAHPGLVHYRASGDRCSLFPPGFQSERHPDLALYLTPAPDPVNPWENWIPDLVVEVVSKGSEKRDYEDKRREYLAAGVREYWILDPQQRQRRVLILQRAGDVFRERRPVKSYASPLLPGFSLDLPRLFAQAGA
ncbi:MAG: Uma2 family endonuclease [Planctomycetes bacterium]|nr:Uma2 family endonuclease [Planctomycetota bacterium]